MARINVLDKNTINRIAAGEVIDRPASIIKELVENSIDAGATSISIEIRGGGIELIRITDNGCGIDRDDIRVAFVRHATSKIRNAEDLSYITSLGFRGEALASVAAVADVELITKTKDAFTAVRYKVVGGEEQCFEEIGAPDGTTFIIRDIFGCVPVRRKFLKSSATEGSYCNEAVERIALSHPGVSIKYVNNGRNVMYTNGSGRIKDVIFGIYGRDIASEIAELNYESAKGIKIGGCICKPLIVRNNRNTENTFVNGRFIKSPILYKAIEDAYQPYLMQHKYPFTDIYIEIDPAHMDVNVHPTKQEVRFENPESVYNAVYEAVTEMLSGKSLVHRAERDTEEKDDSGVKEKYIPEPFEKGRKNIENSGSNVNTVKSVNTANNVDSTNNANTVYTAKIVSESNIRRAENNVTTGKSVSYLKETETAPVGMVEDGNSTINLAKSKENNVVDNNTDNREDNKEYFKVNDITNCKASNIDNSSQGNRVVNKENNIADTGTYEKEDIKVCISDRKDSDTADITDSVISKVEKTHIIDIDNNNAESVHAPKTVNASTSFTEDAPEKTKYVQQSLFDTAEHTESREDFNNVFSRGYRIVGQIFETYWIVECGGCAYIIDQHAAHEKILYEKFMKKVGTDDSTQLLSPPMIISLSSLEEEVAERYNEELVKNGFVLEHFGGHEYALSEIPLNLYGVDPRLFLLELLDELSKDIKGSVIKSIKEKIATCACKAAVKGNMELSEPEAKELLKQLLEAENPFNCPHGRPVIIDLTKREVEKKFKRIL